MKKGIIFAAILAVSIMLGGCGKSTDEVNANQLDEAQELPKIMGSGELKGKILLSNICQDKESTTFYIYTLSLNHDNEIKLVRAFKTLNAESLMIYDDGLCVGVNMFFDFAENYTRLAITRDGHAGWIDCNGDFTDVNDLLGEKAEEGFTAIGFKNDGRFVYRNDDIEVFYSIDPNSIGSSMSLDKQSYEYNARDFLPMNQSFQKVALEDKYTCWSKFANTDGSKVIFYAMEGVDVTTKKICMMPTIGGEVNDVCVIPATKDVLKINDTEKYGTVFGDAILDWR